MKPWQIAVIVVLGLLIACLGCALLGVINSAIPSPTSTPLPTLAFTKSPPIAVPSPTISSDPRVALKQKIEQALGSGNRNVPRLTSLKFDDPESGAIHIEWAIDDNLTEGLIIYGAQRDAADILQAVQESGIAYTFVLMSGSFPMVDKYGNAKETNAVNLTFSKPTADKINWKNFVPKNIYSVADKAFVWAAFQGDWSPTPAP